MRQWHDYDRACPNTFSQEPVLNIRSLSLIVLAAGASNAAHAAIIIDPFSTPQALTLSGSGGNPKMGSTSTANNAPFAIGGQREFVVRRTAGRGSVVVDVADSFDGAMTFSVPSSTGARALVTWDGSGVETAVDSFAPGSGLYGTPDAFELNFGLGHDLTEKGWNDRVRLNAWADNAVTLTLTFYSSASIFARGAVTVPGGLTVYDPVQDYDVPVFGPTDLLFTNMIATGGTVDDILRGAKAITLQIDALSSQDLVLDLLAVTNGPGTDPTPEPGTLSLLGLGLMSAGVASSRKRLKPIATSRL
jgi:hypothetical protein